jgi:hypothetical protein
VPFCTVGDVEFPLWPFILSPLLHLAQVNMIRGGHEHPSSASPSSLSRAARAFGSSRLAVQERPTRDQEEAAAAAFSRAKGRRNSGSVHARPAFTTRANNPRKRHRNFKIKGAVKDSRVCDLAASCDLAETLPGSTEAQLRRIFPPPVAELIIFSPFPRRLVRNCSLFERWRIWKPVLILMCEFLM